LRIFRMKNCVSPVYFFLIDKSGAEAISSLNDMLFVFKTWLLLGKSQCFFHGAGIADKKNGAFLFLGPSGAGKSTVSAFSAELGYKVIHDDHVVAMKKNNGKFVIYESASSHSKLHLKAVFFLIQDTMNKMIPLSQAQRARVLFKSLFELPSEKILYGPNLINAFTACADIARDVPGYELHFTKSPTFWKVIEDELGI
jgi:hypothetical protein